MIWKQGIETRESRFKHQGIPYPPPMHGLDRLPHPKRSLKPLFSGTSPVGAE
jgi:hypothetical protein